MKRIDLSDLLLTILFFLLMTSVVGSHVVYLFLGFLLFRFSNFRRENILYWLNLVHIFGYNLLPNSYERSHTEYVLISIGVLFFYFVCFILQRVMKPLFFRYLPLIFVFILTLFHSKFDLFWQSVIAMLIIHLWYNLGNFLGARRESDYTLKNFLNNQMPFFSNWIIPFPSVCFGTRVNDFRSGDSLNVFKKRAVKYLIVAFFIKLIWEKFIYMGNHDLLIRSMLGSEEIQFFGIASHLQIKYTALEKWIISGGTVLAHLFLALVYYTPLAAYLLFVGYEVQFPVGNPFKSRAYFEFLETFNRYYVRFLLDLFIYPIYKKTSHMGKEKSVLISFPLGVLMGGLFYHYLVRFNISHRYNPTFTNFLHVAPYWLIMAFFVWASILFERFLPTKFGAKTFFGHSVSVVFYFFVLVSTFIFVKDFNVNFINFEYRYKFFFSLFGIQ